MKKILLACMLVLLATCSWVWAEEAVFEGVDAQDFYGEIAQHDLAGVFGYVSPRPLGFIGDNAQRFYIHFTSITKSPDNPYQYLAAGKTRVKNNICTFQGIITVTQAVCWDDKEHFPDKPGGLIAEMELLESREEPGSGFIKGRMETNFVLDLQGGLKYDTLWQGEADGYANNLFVGTWTSYKTGVSKVCNFGHWRVLGTGLPEGVYLDKGAAQFLPSDEYMKNGWQSYVECHDYYIAPGDRRAPEQIREQACREEQRQWWK